MRYVGIDPGIGHTGIVVLDSDRKTIREAILYRGYGPRTKDWQTRIRETVGAFHVFLEKMIRPDYGKEDCLRIAIELPQYFSASGGHMLAAQGGLVKLAVLAGSLATVPSHMALWCDVELVEVNRWKGQLTKEVIKAHVRQCLGVKECRAACLRLDLWDAAGLALWAAEALPYQVALKKELRCK